MRQSSDLYTHERSVVRAKCSSDPNEMDNHCMTESSNLATSSGEKSFGGKMSGYCDTLGVVVVIVEKIKMIVIKNVSSCPNVFNLIIKTSLVQLPFTT